MEQIDSFLVNEKWDLRIFPTPFFIRRPAYAYSNYSIASVA